MRRVKLSAQPIPAPRLADRTLIVRTGRGNFAKMQVRSGHMSAGSDAPEMTVDRLTFYTVDSCIRQAAANVTLRSGYSLDLGTGRETRTGGDIRWHRSVNGAHILEPLNGAELFELPDTYDVTDLRAVRFNAGRARVGGLRAAPLYLRTRKGRLARLIVDGGKAPQVRELTVLDEDGDVHLHRTGLSLTAGETLDLDGGKLGDTRHYDLRYEVEAAGKGGYLSASEAARYVPGHVYQMFKYTLQLATARPAMVFEDKDGALAYDQWSEARKAQLHEWLYMRETGQEFPLAGPPPLDSEGTMAACSAWKIYLAHVVQSFWVDANQLVPWRLADANDETLEHLFDSRRLLHFDESGHRFASGVMGLVTDWSPFFCWDFVNDNDLLRSSQWSTIKKIVEWARANLIHISGWEHDNDGPFDSQEDQWDYIFGYRGPPPVHRMVNPRPGRKHITHGCWGTDGFLAAVLRSVNIPLRHGRSDLNGNNHSRPEFFTVGRNLPHGDDPYNGWTKLGQNNVPIHRIFYTDAELEDLIDSPEPLPGKTVGETAAFHHSKHTIALAVEYKTNYLLRKRCEDRVSGASGPDSVLGSLIGEYYTPSELAQIEADCDAALDAIPGGCGAVVEGA
jgi:hypothetical protein